MFGALIACYLPWINHPAAALSFNAYDLAEWTSLSPAVRSGSLPLLAPFLLRAVFGGLALLFGLRALRSDGIWARLGYALLALILALTLLPPFEFFRGAGDDPNYRQQALITLGTFFLLGLFVFLWTRPRFQPFTRWLDPLVAIVTILAGLVGEVLARNVLLSLHLEAPLGPGIVALVACLGLWLIVDSPTSAPERTPESKAAI